MTESTDDPLFALETRVNAITDQTGAEAMAEMITRCDWIGARAREIKKQFEGQFLNWLVANGDLTIGDVRYYAGNSKREKCNDIRATVIALYEETGGDFDLFVEALSANAIKVGAARKILGNRFAALFTTTTETDLKTGKPVQMVHRLDTRFVKSTAANVAEGSDQ